MEKHIYVIYLIIITVILTISNIDCSKRSDSDHTFSITTFIHYNSTAKTSTVSIINSHSTNYNKIYKFGFINKTGKMVIDPIYEEVLDFKEGLAAIKINGKWGFIDHSGKMVILAKFEEVNNFCEDLACVAVLKDSPENPEEKVKWYGYINKFGEFAIEPNYLLAQDFSEGLAPVFYSSPDMEGNCGMMDHRDYINTDGEIEFTIGNCCYADTFSEGLAVVDIWVKMNEESRYGYIDKSGKIVIKPQFMTANKFQEGFAVVVPEQEPIQEPLHGYIDETGNMVIPGRFTNARNFKNGSAMVTKEIMGGKAGYIDYSGEMIIKPKFVYPQELCSDFTDELAAIGFISSTNLENHRLIGFIDQTGKIIIKPQYTYAKSFSEELAAVHLIHGKDDKKSKWGYIDKTGKLVIQPDYDDAGDFSEGLAWIKLEDKK